MIAVTMPLFVFAEFADQSLAWLADNPLALLVFVAGLLACGFLALLWHDTRDDDRGELDDTPPRSKVVQLKDGTPVYTPEQYRALVEKYQHAAEDASQAAGRILDTYEAERARHAEQWAKRPKKGGTR